MKTFVCFGLLATALWITPVAANAYEETSETKLSVEVKPAARPAPPPVEERTTKESHTVVDGDGEVKREQRTEERSVRQAVPPPPAPDVVEKKTVEEYRTRD